MARPEVSGLVVAKSHHYLVSEKEPRIAESHPVVTWLDANPPDSCFTNQNVLHAQSLGTLLAASSGVLPACTWPDMILR